MNETQSAAYVADESARKRYWAMHSTFMACIKCMDGRVLFSNMTKTPVGIVKGFRAIGGKFESWWPSFLGRMRHWVDRAVSQGSLNCVFVSYHFSASDEHLGCAGWKYDTKSARAHAEKLASDLAFVFGDQLTAIVAGIETDRDNLILHGPSGDVSGDKLIGKTDEEIMAALRAAFPAIDPTVAVDIIPFLRGNAVHVDELIKEPRTEAAKHHHERVIALGQGFDWLAEANLALIINDADPNLDESVRVAGSLIEKNLAQAPEDDATIFACIPYRHPGTDERQAVARAKGLLAFAKKTVQDAYPQLAASARLHGMAAIMWEPSKKIQVVQVE